MFKAKVWENFGNCRMHVVADESFSTHLDRKPKISAASHVSNNERERKTPPSQRPCAKQNKIWLTHFDLCGRERRSIHSNLRTGQSENDKREKKEGKLAYKACTFFGEDVHTQQYYMWEGQKSGRAQTKNPSQTGKKDGEGHRTTLKNKESPAIVPKSFALLDLCVKIVDARMQSKNILNPEVEGRTHHG